MPLGSPDETYNSDDDSTLALQQTETPNPITRTPSEEGPSDEASSESDVTRHKVSQSFQLATTASPTRQTGARSPEYARVLERYLSRLVQMKQIPPALMVLSREIERNPDDPGLYERLAVFPGSEPLGRAAGRSLPACHGPFPRQILV